MSDVLFQIQSTCIMLLFFWGVSQRKNRKRHVPAMLGAIGWDLILVLQIELNRSAIEKAMDVPKNTDLLNFHVAIAVSTVLLYFVMIWLGRKLLRGETEFKKIHRNCGILTLVLRSLVYITSFFVA